MIAKHHSGMCARALCTAAVGNAVARSAGRPNLHGCSSSRSMSYSASSSTSVDVTRTPAPKVPRRRYVSRRGFSTSSFQSQPSSSSDGAQPSQKSSFDLEPSSWDHILGNLDGARPFPRAPTPKPKPAPTQPRRQAMTARELKAFDDMFTMIFERQSKATGDSSTSGAGETDLSTHRDETQRKLGSLFGLLPSQRRQRWSSDADNALDLKKEQMDLCETDCALLQWAAAEVFGESKRYEEAARRALAKGPDAKSAYPTLQPPAYAEVLALLMRTFRDKYRSPHLALAIFDQARTLSIHSFVFGCTTPAYNELIETRWSCFRDLRGVCEALEEMKANGIQPDSQTRKLVDNLRREFGQRSLWIEESDEDTGEVWNMMSTIEKLVARAPADDRRAGLERTGPLRRPSKSGSRKTFKPPLNAWKDPQYGLNDDKMDYGLWPSRGLVY